MLLRTCIGWIHIEERVMMLGWAASVRAHPVGYMPRNVGARHPIKLVVAPRIARRNGSVIRTRWRTPRQFVIMIPLFSTNSTNYNLVLETIHGSQVSSSR